MASDETAKPQQFYNDPCFPVVLDQETGAMFAQQNVNLAELQPEVEGLIEGNGGSYNKALIFLHNLIENLDDRNPTHHWAVLKFLQVLVRIRDPRYRLLEMLNERCAAFFGSGDDGGESERMRAKLSRHIAARKRTRSNWYPRARFQLNSRTFLKSELGLDDNDCRPLEAGTRFFVTGTCFARNIHAAFEKRGMPSRFVARQEEIPAEQQFLALMEEADIAAEIGACERPAVILTLGFAEAATLSKEGMKEDGGRMAKFRTPEFICERIVEGVQILTRMNPNVRIFITVSPVPLEGTASSFNVFEANAISKSIVRYAVAMAGERGPSLSYFPSYEIVTQVAPGIGMSGFGNDDGHPRHVDAALVDFICSLFLETYCPWAG